MKKGPLELIFIIDKSTAMHGLEDAVASEFNARLREQQGIEGEALITTVLFDDRKIRDAVKMEEEEMRSEELRGVIVRKAGKEGWRDRLRLACEISARHYAEPGSGFRFICRCTEARDFSWSEMIEGIYTAKENRLVLDEYASLLIWQSYMADTHCATYETAKAKAAKEIIRRHNKTFGGSLTDAETMRQARISRKTFYKYKKEIRENIS